MATIDERVRQVITKWLEVSPEDITNNSSIFEDLGADSLDAVQILLELEKEFGIEIPDEDADRIKTVGEAIEYIKKQVKGA